jgi:hypothetical protein
MKHVFSISCAAFLSLVLLATSCQKGDTGPEGPQGPAGPAGPQGPKGDTGVANVIYSAWLDVTYQPITDTVAGVVDTVSWFTLIPAPKLSLDILNKGDVKVYINVDIPGDPAIFPLPYFDGEVIINPLYYLNTIQLVSNFPANTTGTGANKRRQYRYVLIPGGAAARSNINWSDYKDVQAKLGLQD